MRAQRVQQMRAGIAQPQVGNCKQVTARFEQQRQARALPGRDASFLEQVAQFAGVAPRRQTQAFAATSEAHL